MAPFGLQIPGVAMRINLSCQTDGNLVLYGPGGPRWTQQTWRSPANRVIMRDDGNLVMYGPTGAVWPVAPWDGSV